MPQMQDILFPKEGIMLYLFTCKSELKIDIPVYAICMISLGEICRGKRKR